jgi:NADPH2:quinone reductase
MRCFLLCSEWVLINAAAGGVGSAAVQIAKYFNCVVVATCGSSEKARVCKELGADYVVNYNEDQNWGTTIKELTVKAGKKFAGVDVFC